MFSVFKKILKQIHIFQNIYIKNNYLIKKKTYSMDCEDLEIIKHLKNINNGFYVDVGCYHPLEINNTYLLYKKNWRGINIDTSKFSIELFNYLRPDDVNVNIAIANEDGEVDYYYQKQLSKLSTISKLNADKVFQGLIKKKKIQTNKLTTLISKTKFKNKKIDFLNVDVEGVDLEVLKSLDFDIYRPKLICIEIINNSINIEDSETYKFLKKLNYIKKWSGVFSHVFVDNFFINRNRK